MHKQVLQSAAPSSKGRCAAHQVQVLATFLPSASASARILCGRILQLGRASSAFPLSDIRILWRSCWRALFDGAHEQACMRRARSCLWHAPTALAFGKCVCVGAYFSCLRAHMCWARAVLERASCALSNGIGVYGGPAQSCGPEIMGR